METRLEAIARVRELAQVAANREALWKDNKVRGALVDAIEPPSEDHGKSLLKEEEPINDEKVRLQALGALVQIAVEPANRAVGPENDVLLREVLVEAAGPKENVQLRSRAQILLSLLALNGSCAHALHGYPEMCPACKAALQAAEVQEALMAEKEAEKAAREVEKQRKLEEKQRKQKAKERAERARRRSDGEDVSTDEEYDEEEDAKLAAELDREEEEQEEEEEEDEESEEEQSPPKPSDDNAVLEALLSCGLQTSSAEIPLTGAESGFELVTWDSWQKVEVKSRVLGTIASWCSLADRFAADAAWRHPKLREMILVSTQARAPFAVRDSALGALTALVLTSEKKEQLWGDPSLRKVLITAASKEVMIQDEEEEELGKELQPVEIRLKAFSALKCLADARECQEAMWKDKKLVPLLLSSVREGSRVRAGAAATLVNLSKCKENWAPMLSARVHELLEAAAEDAVLTRRERRVCLCGRDRLLEAEEWLKSWSS